MASSRVLPSLLLSMRNDEDKKQKQPEQVHKQSARSINVRKLPTEQKYILRCLAVSGAEIPKHVKNNITHTTWGLAVQIGQCRVQTMRCENVGGQVLWREPLQTEVELPSDITQVPDVFLYLWHGDDDKPKDVCYARFKVRSPTSFTFLCSIGWAQCVCVCVCVSVCVCVCVCVWVCVLSVVLCCRRRHPRPSTARRCSKL